MPDRQPETTEVREFVRELRAHHPDGWRIGGTADDSHHAKRIRIHPDTATEQELIFRARRGFEEIGVLHRIKREEDEAIIGAVDVGLFANHQALPFRVQRGADYLVHNQPHARAFAHRIGFGARSGVANVGHHLGPLVEPDIAGGVDTRAGPGFERGLLSQNRIFHTIQHVCRRQFSGRDVRGEQNQISHFPVHDLDTSQRRNARRRPVAIFFKTDGVYRQRLTELSDSVSESCRPRATLPA